MLMNNTERNKKMITAAVCLALCMVLPFLTGQIPKLGNALCPMHLPVIICGFAAGPQFGLLTGLIAPLLRTAAFGMPKLFPTAIAMSAELAVYGFASGLFYKKLSGVGGRIIISLILAMLSGRLVWGGVTAVLLGISGQKFTLVAFITGAFTGAVPGIILQIILIPLIVSALERSGFIHNEKISEKNFAKSEKSI